MGEIKAFMDIFDITHPDQRIEFLDVIRALDLAYLENQREDSEKGTVGSNNG